MDWAALADAREKYGSRNQVMVAAEECVELCKVLLKYPRFKTHGKAMEKLREDAIDEMADVILILDHVRSIFDVSDKDLHTHMKGKLQRLREWIEDEDNTLEYSTEHREVKA
jgi:NTP pyrophosphatase (non-canonical NTP hydrolase)